MTQPTEDYNILIENIMQTDGKKYDAAVKKLLANKVILAKILQECVEEFKDCSLEDIEKKYIEGEPHVNLPALSGRASRRNTRLQIRSKNEKCIPTVVDTAYAASTTAHIGYIS